MGRLSDAIRHEAINMVAGVRRHEVTGSVADRPRLGCQRVTSLKKDHNIVLSHRRDGPSAFNGCRDKGICCVKEQRVNARNLLELPIVASQTSKIDAKLVER
ncbi:hypothetical protein MAR_031355, partial [Mya arenaria]